MSDVATTILTDDKSSKPWQFKKGNNANPAGRPVGSRNKLGEKFVADVLAAWEREGPAVLAAMIEKRPWAFANLVAQIIPKEFNIDKDLFKDTDDADIAKMLFQLKDALAAREQK